jgi:hypothetical protein
MMSYDRYDEKYRAESEKKDTSSPLIGYTSEGSDANGLELLKNTGHEMKSLAPVLISQQHVRHCTEMTEYSRYL